MEDMNLTLIENVSTGMPVVQKRLRDWLEFQIGMWLAKYVLISFVILGTIGNLLSFLVLMRKRMRNNSVNFYLVLLAVADTSVLYVSALKTWVRIVTGFELLHVSRAGCKITMFLFMLSSHLSAWFVVLLTTDRFIAVRFPFRAVSLCSLRRSRLRSAVLFVVMIVYNVHLFWSVDLFEAAPGILQCAPKENNTFMNGAFNYMKMATYGLVPFTIVLAMNVVIIVRICQTSSHFNSDGRRSMQYQVANNASFAQHNKHQVTTMLLMISFAWLFLSMPYAVISLIDFEYPDTRARAQAFLMKTTSFLLMYLNHSCNFLLYCIAGKKFRTEFAAMVKDWGHLIRHPCKKPHPVHDTTNRTSKQRGQATMLSPVDEKTSPVGEKTSPVGEKTSPVGEKTAEYPPRALKYLINGRT